VGYALLLVIHVSSSATAAPADTQWATVEAPDKKFQIQFPIYTSNPPLEPTKQTIEGIELTDFASMSPDRDEGFFLEFFDIPADRMGALEDPRQLLEALMQNILLGKQGKLAKSAPITVGDNPGLEFTFEGGQDQSYFFKSRVVFAKPRVYELLAGVKKPKALGPTHDQFLKSLQVSP